jgi:hypothetical protein
MQSTSFSSWVGDAWNESAPPEGRLDFFFFGMMDSWSRQEMALCFRGYQNIHSTFVPEET